MHRYQPRTLKIATILDRTGLGDTRWATEHDGTAKKQFKRAMVQLKDASILDQWDMSVSGEPTDWAETDDANAIAQYYAHPCNTDWRARVGVVHYPKALRERGKEIERNRARRTANGRRGTQAKRDGVSHAPNGGGREA